MKSTALFKFFSKYLLLLPGLWITTVCTSPYRPQSGDLVFVVSENSAFSQAIVAATAQQESIKYSHVAILALHDGKPCVLEASSQNGVTRTDWLDFLQKAPTINNKPGLVIMRVNTDFPITDAITRAEEHLGEAYDWLFLPDNGKMYCSELVYECFRYADGSPLFTARPMNFRDADGHLPEFWKTLFANSGERVPEGVLGTNPNDLSKESCLTEVYRFF